MTDAPNLFPRIDLFLDLLTKLYEEHYVAQGFTKSGMVSPYFSIMSGTKSIKVVVQDRNRNRDTGEVEISKYGKSVYCFIDRATGDLLKAAGWKAPAKGKRGSIFNDNCDVGVKATVYGSGLYIR